jgi:hypothetical protein
MRDAVVNGFCIEGAEPIVSQVLRPKYAVIARSLGKMYLQGKEWLGSNEDWSTTCTACEDTSISFQHIQALHMFMLRHATASPAAFKARKTRNDESSASKSVLLM